ncbi:MAG: cyclic nucleotide-binding domain-containing protein [Verrucomicrobia bacterium]|nr:cyclic nucleotide-binding domain-containing protein [Verrucomicrobiota bacterium]
MSTASAAPTYHVWGADNIAYGPFELPALVTWVKQRRIGADTWVFVGKSREWMAAGKVSELKMFFDQKPGVGAEESGSPSGLKAENLRRIRVFADMDHHQLESLLPYLEVVKASKFSKLFSRGDLGDAMYSILDGQMRASIEIEGKETNLFVMQPGETFGEIALLAETPRASDVFAGEDSTLVRMSAAAFRALTKEAPALAAPLLLSIGRMVSVRALEMGKRYEAAIRSARILVDSRLL